MAISGQLLNRFFEIRYTQPLKHLFYFYEDQVLSKWYKVGTPL